MSEPLIMADHLSKTFRVSVRAAGLRAALGGAFRRRYQDVEALRDVSFSVRAGEMVGFLGPNGAGKTTTLKMLAGLLYPTAGTARVAGYVPWERRPAYLRQIAIWLRGDGRDLFPDSSTITFSLSLPHFIWAKRVPSSRCQQKRTMDTR